MDTARHSMKIFCRSPDEHGCALLPTRVGSSFFGFGSSETELQTRGEELPNSSNQLDRDVGDQFDQPSIDSLVSDSFSRSVGRSVKLFYGGRVEATTCCLQNQNNLLVLCRRKTKENPANRASVADKNRSLRSRGRRSGVYFIYVSIRSTRRTQYRVVREGVSDCLFLPIIGKPYMGELRVKDHKNGDIHV